MKSLKNRGRRSARLLLVLLLAFAFGASSAPTSYAYIQFSSPGTGAAAGTFVFERWPALPINYSVDNGPAPTGFTEATLVTTSFNAWAGVSTSNVAFTRVANTTGDTNWTSTDFGTTWGISTDNNYEVIYDDGGTFLGGADNLGRGVRTANTTTGNITDAYLLLNTAPAAGSDIPATAVHEVGHTLGLAHTDVGNQDATIQFRLGDAAIPTMYPFAFPTDDSQGRTLEVDDISSVSTIYPETVNSPPAQVPWRQDRGSISGYVFAGNNGNFARGVHVRAINTADNNIQASRLSDFGGQSTGEFLIEGLPPGNYNVIIEAIDGRDGITPGRIEADGIGGPGNAYSGFSDDLFANPESNGETLTSTVNVSVFANWQTSGVYVVTNQGSAPDLVVRPWGVEDHQLHEPFWSSSDVRVDNDMDGVPNEPGEPSRGLSGNQLSAVIRNIGNTPSQPYKVVFSFSPYTTAGAAMPQQIASVNMPALAAGGSVPVGPVAWNLTTTALASFPPEFQMTDHYCVKVEVMNQDGMPTLTDADRKNNFAQSNYGNVPVDPSGGRTSFFMFNEKNSEAKATLQVMGLPRGWEMTLNDGPADQEFVLRPGEMKLVKVEVKPLPGFFAPEAPGQQGIQIAQLLDGVRVGGLTINFIDPVKFPPVKPKPWFYCKDC